MQKTKGEYGGVTTNISEFHPIEWRHEKSFQIFVFENKKVFKPNSIILK